jgi:hypothetical protein
MTRARERDIEDGEVDTSTTDPSRHSHKRQRLRERERETTVTPSPAPLFAMLTCRRLHTPGARLFSRDNYQAVDGVQDILRFRLPILCAAYSRGSISVTCGIADRRSRSLLIDSDKYTFTEEHDCIIIKIEATRDSGRISTVKDDDIYDVYTACDDVLRNQQLEDASDTFDVFLRSKEDFL